MSIKKEAGQRGGVSLLMIAVLVPVLFFFLTTTAEISAFFQSRQAVQEEVDRAAKHLARHPSSRSFVERNIRSRMGGLRAMVEVSSVRTSIQGSETRIVVDARHKAHISSLFFSLSGGNQEGIQFEVQSAVRKMPTEATIILDRSIASSDGCHDVDFIRMKSFAGDLMAGLGQIGVQVVSVGIVPSGGGVPVQRVELHATVDGLPRCGTGEYFASLTDSLLQLQGSRDAVVDPLGVAMGIQEFMFGDREMLPVTRQLLFVITNNFDGRWGSLPEVVEMISKSAHEGALKVLLRHIALVPAARAGTIDAGAWRSELARGGVGLESRLITVESGQGLEATLLTAMLSSVDTMVFAE
jgi:Flp pilus assembly protein TadG